LSDNYAALYPQIFKINKIVIATLIFIIHKERKENKEKVLGFFIKSC